MVFSADVVSGLASGMTIKFFPIFFMDKVNMPILLLFVTAFNLMTQRQSGLTSTLCMQSHLSPMENSLLAASTPVAIATGIFVAQRLSSAVGRVPTILTFKCAPHACVQYNCTNRPTSTVLNVISLLGYFHHSRNFEPYAGETAVQLLCVVTAFTVMTYALSSVLWKLLTRACVPYEAFGA